MQLKYKITELRKRNKKGNSNEADDDELNISAINAPAEFVGQCARKYAMLHFPWVEMKEHIDDLEPDIPQIDPTDPQQRYENDNTFVTMELARMAEIHALLAANAEIKNQLGEVTWITDKVRC